MSWQFLWILGGWIEFLVRGAADIESFHVTRDMIHISLEGSESEIDEITMGVTVRGRRVPLR
jgi:hypothetical protein